MGKKAKTKYVCSLGFNCHAAQILKTNGLKKASYPFDWIMSNISVVKNCIEDDFKVFLDRNNYLDLGREDRCGHSIYCDNTFVHHNPLYKQEDYDYFVRCVNRFRELLNTNRHKLFIISIINGEHNVGDKLSEKITNDFIELNNVLRSKTTNYKLLLIVNYPNKQLNNHIITEIDELTILEIYTLSENNGTNFCYKEDDIFLFELIKKKYKFKLLNVMNKSEKEEENK
jgi:hypothetical protein